MAQLTLVRFREFIREPEAVFWTFVFPILLAAGLGIAFRQRGPDKIQVGVISSAPGSTSMVESLKRDSTLVLRTYDDSSGARALRTGKVALLVVPTARPDSVRYVYDRGRSDAANARIVVDHAVQSGAGRADPVRATDTYVTEKGSRYIDFLIPGLLGMNLMGSSIWGLGFAIVTARSKKLLKRLMATPMSHAQFLWSFVLMRAAFFFLELPLLLLFGWFAFGVGVAGSLALLVGLSLLGALAFAGLGLLVAARAQNTQTVSGLINLVMLPMFIASGVFFSTARFPEAFQPFLRALPLTALNDSLRAVMIEGAGPRAVAGEAALLAAVGAVSFALALRLFRWR